MIALASTGWGIAQGRAPGTALASQDYIDIHKLYATYAGAYDTREGEDAVWAETFTPEGWRIKRRAEVARILPLRGSRLAKNKPDAAFYWLLSGIRLCSVVARGHRHPGRTRQ